VGEGFLFSFFGKNSRHERILAMVICMKDDVVTFAQITPVHTTYTAGSWTFDALPLQLGGSFGPVTLAYETWGTLNSSGDNAILLTHANWPRQAF
jgi:homoserine O-acetyltransferase